MFSVNNRSFITGRKLIKHVLDISELSFNSSTCKNGIVKCVPVRCQSRTPPGVSRIEPKPIPYTFGSRQQPSRAGGELLMLIPIISFGLGTWQVKRLKWKQKLMEDMERKTSMDPVPLPLNPAEVAEMEFQKVSVTGTFDHDNEIYLGPKPCMKNGEIKRDVVHPDGRQHYGYHLVTPLVVSGTNKRVLVDRGWILTKTMTPEKRPWSKTEGEQTITGLVRLADKKNLVAAEKDLKYKIWHIRDIQDMADYTDSLPILIEATDEHSIPGKLWGGQSIPKLRNEHMTYIFTWYTLSLITAFMWYKRYYKR